MLVYKPNNTILARYPRNWYHKYLYVSLRCAVPLNSRGHLHTHVHPSHRSLSSTLLCFMMLNDWLSSKIKKRSFCTVYWNTANLPFLNGKNESTKQNQSNSRITFGRSVNSHVPLSHARNKKHTLLIAQAVFSRVDPLLVLMILDKSSRAARRWANVMVDFGDNA